MHAHPDLTGPGFRHGQLSVLQDLRPTELRHLDAVHRPRPFGGSSPLESACSSSVLRGGVNMSTSTHEDSRVWAPCGTHGGITATSPGRMVRDSPSMWNSNSPSSTTTICSSSWTWVGANVWGANDTKLAIAFSPSTGRNARPGTNSTGSMSSTLTKRPGPVGTPWAWLLKCASPLLLVILNRPAVEAGEGRPRPAWPTLAPARGLLGSLPEVRRAARDRYHPAGLAVHHLGRLITAATLEPGGVPGGGRTAGGLRRDVPGKRPSRQHRRL